MLKCLKAALVTCIFTTIWNVFPSVRLKLQTLRTQQLLCSKSIPLGNDHSHSKHRKCCFQHVVKIVANCITVHNQAKLHFSGGSSRWRQWEQLPVTSGKITKCSKLHWPSTCYSCYTCYSWYSGFHDVNVAKSCLKAVPKVIVKLSQLYQSGA